MRWRPPDNPSPPPRSPPLRACPPGSSTPKASENTSTPPANAKPPTATHPPRPGPTPAGSRSHPPACAPTSPSLVTRSTDYEQFLTNSGAVCGCNLEPRSNNPTGPNSSHGSPRWKPRTASTSPNATPAQLRPTPPNAASNNSKTTSPPPEKASDESSGTPTGDDQQLPDRALGPRRSPQVPHVPHVPRHRKCLPTRQYPGYRGDKLRHPPDRGRC